MGHDGSKWVGYLNYTPLAGATDPKGPIVSATAPEKTGGQSDGTDLVEGDIWVSTADVDAYGAKVYRWDNSATEWVLIDVTDQTTEDGIVFADARYGSAGATGDTAATIEALLSSNYVDPDAPDPDLYPRGMLLWNTRRSGFNVKKFVANQIDITANSGKNTRFGDEAMAAYKTARWIGWNTTKEDGSGLFGRISGNIIDSEKTENLSGNGTFSYPNGTTSSTNSIDIGKTASHTHNDTWYQSDMRPQSFDTDLQDDISIDIIAYSVGTNTITHTGANISHNHSISGGSCSNNLQFTRAQTTISFSRNVRINIFLI